MTAESRFRDIEGATFPAVQDYSYPDNKQVRGIDDRTFRWTEVYVPDLWQFRETTFNGSLETLTVSGYQQLTTGTNTNSTAITGWVCTGDKTFLLNTTGHFFTSSELPGLTGTLQAISLTDGYSLGLWSAGNTSRVEQSLALSGNTQYQAYLETIPAYGDVELRVLIEGYPTGTKVYYNQVSGVWQTGIPDPVVLAGHYINYYKFSFTTTGYPFSAPTGFKYAIQNSKSGTFAILDELHIDEYLYKNPYIDFVLPTGYLLQITPDLGWHDMLSMFEQSDSKNPHLRTMGPYSITQGNLLDESDGSVSVTLTTGQLDGICHPDYRSFLWRAIAISPNTTLGDAGLPAKYEYIGRVLDSEFSVDNILESANSPVKIITGTRTHRMTITVDGEDHPGTSYPTDTTWKLIFILESPSKRIAIQGVDSGGTLTSIRYLDLNTDVYPQKQQELWNVFDEHALLVDIARLPQEGNRQLYHRIRDYFRNPGGFSFEGVVNGGLRELGLSKITDGIIISPARDSYNRIIHNPINIIVGAASIIVRSESMRRTELHKVDPIRGTIDLNRLPWTCPDGYSLPDEIEDRPFIYRVRIDKEDLYGTIVEITYDYAEELKFKDFDNLKDIILALSKLTNPSDINLFDKVLISDKLAGGEDCFGLYQGAYSLGKTNITIPWSKFFLRRVGDRQYREHFRVEDEPLWFTKYYEIVKKLKATNHTFWGHIEIDKDFWNEFDSNRQGFDVVPTQFDPGLSFYYSPISGSVRSSILDSIEAFGRQYIGYSGETLDNQGLRPDQFNPGVGYKPDLKVNLHITNSQELVTGSNDYILAHTLMSNNTIFFSGDP